MLAHWLRHGLALSIPEQTSQLASLEGPWLESRVLEERRCIWLVREGGLPAAAAAAVSLWHVETGSMVGAIAEEIALARVDHLVAFVAMEHTFRAASRVPCKPTGNAVVPMLLLVVSTSFRISARIAWLRGLLPIHLLLP